MVQNMLKQGLHKSARNSGVFENKKYRISLEILIESKDEFILDSIEFLPWY